MKRVAATGAVICALTLCSGAAVAGEPGAGAGSEAAPAGVGVAVLMPRHDADTITVAQAQAFREAVVRALGEAHLAALDLKEVDRRLTVADLSCSTSQCLARRAELLNTRLLLGGKLERIEETAGWAVALWLYDAKRKSTRAALESRCQACTEEENLKRAGPLTVKLLEEALHTQGARIEVRSRPEGASVRIDKELVGVTNMTFGVKPGVHMVEVSHKASGGQRRYKVKVSPGRKILVEADLIGGGRGAVMVGSLNAGIWKWVSLGIGIAGVGAGAALWALDGRQTCDKAEDYFQCPEHYDTGGPGIGLVVAGGVVLAGAALLFVLDAGGAKEEEEGAPAGKSAGIAPWVGRKAGGLSAAVSF